MVHHSAGSSNNHLNAASNCVELGFVTLSAIDCNRAKARNIGSIFLECNRHLNGQFTGRRQNQDLWCVDVHVQSGQDRTRERGGLSRTGFGLSNNIVPLQHMRNRFRLNWCRNEITGCLDRRDDRWNQVEFLKSRSLVCDFHDTVHFQFFRFQLFRRRFNGCQSFLVVADVHRFNGVVHQFRLNDVPSAFPVFRNFQSDHSRSGFGDFNSFMAINHFKRNFLVHGF